MFVCVCLYGFKIWLPFDILVLIWCYRPTEKAIGVPHGVHILCIRYTHLDNLKANNNRTVISSQLTSCQCFYWGRQLHSWPLALRRDNLPFGKIRFPPSPSTTRRDAMIVSPASEHKAGCTRWYVAGWEPWFNTNLRQNSGTWKNMVLWYLIIFWTWTIAKKYFVQDLKK